MLLKKNVEKIVKNYIGRAYYFYQFTGDYLKVEIFVTTKVRRKYLKRTSTIIVLNLSIISIKIMQNT